MESTSYLSLAAFAEAALPALERRDLENGLLLAMIEQRQAAPEITPTFMAVSRDGGEVAGAAWHIPEWKLVLSTMPAPAAVALADLAADAGLHLPGVKGPAEAVAEFSRRFADRSQARIEPCVTYDIYRCDRLAPPRSLPPGRLRLASITDLEANAEWGRPTSGNISAREQALATKLRKTLIDLKRFYFWDDGGPVAAAAVGGETRNGFRLSNIMTLQANRRRGYGSAAVAGLTAICHGRGKFVFLDVARTNETAIRVYRGLGYQRCGELHECSFIYP